MVLPEYFASLGVVDDRRFGADIRHFTAELVDAESRRLQVFELAGLAAARARASCARRARAVEGE